MAVPCELGLILELSDLRRELDSSREELALMKARLNEALGGESLEALDRERADLTDKIADLGLVKEGLEEDVQEHRHSLSRKRELLEARRRRLDRARQIDELKAEDQMQQTRAVEAQESTLSTILSRSATRRTQLITLLSQIFPIDPSPLSPHSFLFTIVDLPLPNSSYPSSISDESLSSALSYVAQVVQTLSCYLAVPLAYPIRCQGSRSAILDPISSMKGPRAFPLYRKGVEGYRFDYAVFLLNKDIEQLMHTRGLLMTDLRNTLPNLKTLMLSLSYDPSHEAYEDASTAPKLFAPPHAQTLEGSQVDSAAHMTDDVSAEGTSGRNGGANGYADESPLATPRIGQDRQLNGKGPASERSTSPASTIRARSRSNTIQSTRTILPGEKILHHAALPEQAEEPFPAISDEGEVKAAELGNISQGTIRAKSRGGWAVDVGTVAGSVSGAVGSFWRSGAAPSAAAAAAAANGGS